MGPWVSPPARPRDTPASLGDVATPTLLPERCAHMSCVRGSARRDLSPGAHACPVPGAVPPEPVSGTSAHFPSFSFRFALSCVSHSQAAHRLSGSPRLSGPFRKAMAQTQIDQRRGRTMISFALYIFYSC